VIHVIQVLKSGAILALPSACAPNQFNKMTEIGAIA